ncbi:MAG TPA: Na/Pi cotransporter family protein [Acetobacteraceae bacterium]|nr:Na/Pi cotransporter family protein [Acetobacteraceae bacterium]
MSGMDFPVTLLNLAGSIALLLWGVRMVQTGVQRAFGARLRTTLGSALRSPAKAFLAGLGVTAILQSSTATGLMVTGFAAGGLVDLVPALAVMLGANVGTTLIVQLLAFDLSPATPALILLGVLMFRRGQSSRTHDLGRLAVGLGLMLLALHQLLDLVTPFEDEPSLRLMLGAIATQPWLDVIVAAGMTWAAHSSVAIVLLVMSLAAKGVVPPDAAFALVFGANLGTAINPLLEGTDGSDAAARRVPAGNLGTRLIGVALGLAALPKLGPWLVTVVPDTARAVADLHLIFNLTLAALFFPVLPYYAALLRRMFPARVDPPDPSHPRYLDEAARETPVVAIGAAAREALRLADMLEAMLQAAQDAFKTDDRKRVAEARHMVDLLDRLNGAIRAYLTGLDYEATSEVDQRRIEEILTFSTNLEHAGDVVDKNLLGHAAKRSKRNVPLSSTETEEVATIVARLLANLRAAASVFMTEDVRAARLLAAEKEAFREIEASATEDHFAKIRTGQAQEATASAWRLDLLRDLKRINDHLIAAAAYPILKGQGELLPTRLRDNE